MSKTIMAIIAAGALVLVLGWGASRHVSSTGPEQSPTDDTVAVSSAQDSVSAKDITLTGTVKNHDNAGEPHPRVEINFNLNQTLQENGTRKDIIVPERPSTRSEETLLSRLLSYVVPAGIALLLLAFLRRK